MDIVVRIARTQLALGDPLVFIAEDLEVRATATHESVSTSQLDVAKRFIDAGLAAINGLGERA